MSELIYRELLLGCGFRRKRWLDTTGQSGRNDAWQNLVTVDNNPRCHPDYVMELNCHGTQWAIPYRPSLHPELWSYDENAQHCRFLDNIFDEVHAYEVLEHLGQQGDEASFFSHFEEIWRVLRPGGYLCATVPSRFSPWLWGDPGHRRAILPASLLFLRQTQYKLLNTDDPSSDYRHLYGGDFDIVSSRDDQRTHEFVLKAVKPARLEYVRD